MMTRGKYPLDSPLFLFGFFRPLTDFSLNFLTFLDFLKFFTLIVFVATPSEMYRISRSSWANSPKNYAQY